MSWSSKKELQINQSRIIFQLPYQHEADRLVYLGFHVYDGLQLHLNCNMIQITATTYVAKEVSYDIAEDARETEAIARMQAHLSR